MTTPFRTTTLQDYAPLIGEAAVDRIRAKADRMRGIRVADVNSTFYGGGVAELLYSMTLLLNGLGVKSEWRVIAGPPDFFSVTKKMHNALQGAKIHLTEQKKRIYEETVSENAIRMDLDHDFVIVHDQQPLPLIKHYKCRRGPWVWRCHVELGRPDPALWKYVGEFVRDYDAAILSLPEYTRPDLGIPQVFMLPAIDPLSTKNRELSIAEIDERLAHYGIPCDLPLIVQISRFDRWKDPAGVIRAFEIIRKEVDCTLVLLGNVATDDPEGLEVFEEVLEHRSDRCLILSVQDTALVNALQRRAAVVLQKSIREGFGLTVTEAMWKGTPVVGGRVGGIRVQIEDGVNGFLVGTVEEAAERVVRLLKSKDLRLRMGRRARRSVARRFLMTRLLEEQLDLMASFETSYRIRSHPVSPDRRTTHAATHHRTVG